MFPSGKVTKSIIFYWAFLISIRTFYLVPSPEELSTLGEGGQGHFQLFWLFFSTFPIFTGYTQSTQLICKENTIYGPCFLLKLFQNYPLFHLTDFTNLMLSLDGGLIWSNVVILWQMLFYSWNWEIFSTFI